MSKRVIILGVTGSIGGNAVDVVLSHPGEFQVAAVSALRRREECEAAAKRLGAKAYVGEDAALWAVEENDADVCLVATVGLSGLKPTLAAIEKGMDVALATKEVLVMAGELVRRRAEARGVRILPVDSEHSAVFQCLMGRQKGELRRILLTCSGGPFRGRKREELEAITPAQAVKHPRWNMGKKITVDSATLANKGLEIIEAMHLFKVPYDIIKVLIHRQSIVHSMVEFADNSVIAQLSVPDMRLPGQYALTYPDRCEGVIPELDLTKTPLTFEEPDTDAFKMLLVAQYCAKQGGILPCAYNAANEAAVDLYLHEKIGFNDIYRSIRAEGNFFYIIDFPAVCKTHHILYCTPV